MATKRKRKSSLSRASERMRARGTVGKYTKRSGGKGGIGKQVKKDLGKNSRASTKVKREANFARMARRGWKALPNKGPRKPTKRRQHRTRSR